MLHEGIRMAAYAQIAMKPKANSNSTLVDLT